MANRSRFNWPWVLGIFSGALLLLAGAQVLAAQPAAAQTTGGPGPEVCKACHADQYESYHASVMSEKGDPRGPGSAGGCVACHGDGTAHVKAGGGRGVGGIINPSAKSMSAEAKTKICLTCHQGGKRIHWVGGSHQAADVTCMNCHTMHKNKGKDAVLVKITQADVCFACHKEQRAQINRPSRHPVREGKVVCSDCHNPHGSAGPSNLVRDNVNDTCYACHMEKRGPFVRTHQPVQENCAICHNPHGTTQPNLLKSRPPFLCQQCHEPTSHRGSVASLTGTGTSANTLARGCLNCHTNIHGTNNPANISNERTFRR